MSLVNGKNLAVGRLMPRGKDSDIQRLKYIHVGPKGTTVVGPVVVARVSLPTESVGVETSRIIPQDAFDALDRPAPESDRLIDLPQGLPAVTGPHYLVPQIDRCFPDPQDISATFTCNGELLRKLLTVACEVCKDGDKTVRLRISESMNSMRIDAYRQPGDQEFCGVIKAMEYDGSYIPGELPTGMPKVEKKPQQSGLSLKTATGRRFRGDGE
jgi:hypothetical protein